MTRRKAFVAGSVALGGLAGAAVVLPVVGFAVAPVLTGGKERWEAVGTVDDFDQETYRTVVFTETVGIGEAGKTTAYVRQGSPDIKGEDPEGYVAISTRCAHLGCPVRFVQAAGNFICPCHGGEFDPGGKATAGPPAKAGQSLLRYPLKVEGGLLFIEVAADGMAAGTGREIHPRRVPGPGHDPCLERRS